MAAVLTPKSLPFPHNILHDPIGSPSYMKMERKTTPPRPSLPSISSLIGDFDKKTENSPARSPSIDEKRRVSGGSHGLQPPTPDRISFAGSPRIGVSPTSPLPGASSFEFTPRPSGSPITNGNTQNGYFAGSPSSTNLDMYAQQRSTYPPIPEPNHWSRSGSPTLSRRTSHESPIKKRDGAIQSESAYQDLSEGVSTYPGLAQQRPLPMNFPPPIPSPGQQLPPIDPQMAATAYQHHHHYPVTSAAGYQSTDRYQCPTCQKAFSRPSSLKIHTYSHTGEKPFKCKFEGCGKYFSVRSNMKRHEKGCHGVENTSTGENSPKAG